MGSAVEVNTHMHVTIENWKAIVIVSPINFSGLRSDYSNPCSTVPMLKLGPERTTHSSH